jgi:DNA modification methylase
MFGKVNAMSCIEGMLSLPPESIGMILTSPPYNVGLKYDGYDDNLPDDEFKSFNRSWLEVAYGRTQESGRLYTIVSDTMLWWFREVAEAVGWQFAQKLTWCKPNFVGKAGRISGDWSHMTEDILLFRKGKRTPMLHGESTTHNWFVETAPQSNYKEGRIHPAQLPLGLCRKIIGRTPGDPVCDPFAGSGSVLVAAKELGRAFIGFDIVSSVAERANERIDGVPCPMIY